MTPISEDWPTEIRLNPAKDLLHIAFEDGKRFALPAEFLRVYSPSAEVTGHGAEERKIVPGKRDVLIARIEPVGNYAVRLIFSDGHGTGIFSWVYLREVGEGQAKLWEDYLAAVAERGLSRD
nr:MULTISPECIES: DUF971 domain-containing protein [Rhodomicrobium]